MSGSKERRPQLDLLLAECRKRQVDAVVVYRYDRFARSLRQLVNALAEFDALGIQFVSPHEGVDTSTPNGRLVTACPKTPLLGQPQLLDSERLQVAARRPSRISCFSV